MSPKETLKFMMLALGKRFDIEKEYRFHPERRWRFDYACPSLKVGIEYDGHHSTGKTGKKTSGHSSIIGITNDAEKANQAASLGWVVIRFTALHFSQRERDYRKLQDPWMTMSHVLGRRLEDMK